MGGPLSLTPRSPSTGYERHRRCSPSPRCRSVYTFIEEHLDDETYRVPRSEGKAHFLSDIHIKELIPKPYMYVDHLSGQTLKKKSITALEYINAFISLLRDKRLPYNRDHNCMFAHLHDVSRDAARLFDGVVGREFNWSDTQSIQNERFSLAHHMVTKPTTWWEASSMHIYACTVWRQQYSASRTQ